MIPYSDEYLLQYMAQLDIKDYKQGLEEMKNDTDQATKKLNNNFSALGSQITRTIAAKMSLAGVGVLVTRKFIQAAKEVALFGKELSKVNTLLKVSKEELNKYGEQFEKLALNVGVDKFDVVNAAYQALSSGVNKEDLTKFLEVTTKTAIAGQTTVEKSVGVVASVINAYKMEMSEAAKVADWLLILQNKGVTTVEELGSQLGDVTSISSNLGINLNELGGAIAQLTQNGNNTAKTITMLKSMFSELSKQGQQASNNFKKMSGQSFGDFIKNGGTLNEAMQKMEEYAKKSNISIVDLFGSVEAGSAALNLTGLNAEAFNDKIQDITNSAGELETAYKIATDNIYYEWKQLTSSLSKEWDDFVKSVIESEIAYAVIKNIRQGIQEKPEKTLEDYKKDLERINKEIEANKLNIVEQQGNYRPDNSMQNLNAQSKEQELLKTRENLLKRIDKLEKEAIETERKNAEERERIKNSETTRLANLKAQEEDLLKEHNEKITNNELMYLEGKRDYAKKQQILLNDGYITKEEYNKSIEKKDKELLEQQQRANLELYKEMENFYTQLGELDKANQFKKKVIEIEIQITKNGTSNINDVEELFLEEEAQKRKEYQSELLADEWEFLTQLAEMRKDGVINEGRIEEIKEQRMKELELARLNREAEELQNRLNFYNSNAAYKEQAVETLRKIEENAVKREKILGKEKINWEDWKSKYEVKIHERSLGAIMDTYTALAKGQIKSLDDFKKFAQMQIAELLVLKGQEHAAEAISEGGKAIIDFASAATASARLNGPQAAMFIASAKNHLAASAQNAALAAAFGVASSAISPSESSQSSGSGGKTKFDDGINDRVEASKESEGLVYIDVSNSALTKLLIKDIEKELNDGYNVTLVGKKKR